MKTIKEVADAFGMTTRTIRYYEELGMLKPQRTEANRRMYAPAEVAKLKLIDRGKRYGFSLEEIKEMVLLFDVDRSGEKQLERTIEYGEKQIRENEGGLHPAGRRLLLRITNFYHTQQFQFPVNWRYYPESVKYYPHSQNTVRIH
ncbi:MerR family transcriptional regulator [Planomicrobium sp. YIM 101495]|uniref:MerR family transcriptional regulator n=1 Tax=Planomicrobium sp. YIM 101495 TaxID=2665160 RepID=UPI0012B9543A|nr:MerR family transcriptional regulator [Planomicrobium sp. YIM 101495]MTD31869.1 MerR family transcriptional regulator [Planomicrobium sp. YIM 101495]